MIQVKQYGVNKVTVAPVQVHSAGVPAPSSQPISQTEFYKLIEANQAIGKLPLFSSRTVIMVLLGDGYWVNGGVCQEKAGGCHSAESTPSDPITTNYFIVVPKSQGDIFDLVVAHEVFEESAAAAPRTDRGWDEAVDGCDVPPITLGPPYVLYNFGIQIPSPHDNTYGGNCSPSGYTNTDERVVYGASYAEFLDHYQTNFRFGWRLYIVQSYVSNGAVLYDAVWRGAAGKPSDEPNEVFLFDITRDEFLLQNSALYASGGWRLYILQSYVLANGEVRYNAVWHTGTVSQTVKIGQTQTEFLSDYYTLTKQGWRLYILQTYVTSGGEALTNAVWQPGDAQEGAEFGVTEAIYEDYYDIITHLDFRLYSLQPYVQPDGSVSYNAIFRPGDHDEERFHGLSFADYEATYDSLWPDGWRLYVLNVYVLPNGDVRYDAVWRMGTINRPL